MRTRRRTANSPTLARTLVTIMMTPLTRKNSSTAAGALCQGIAGM